MTITIVAHSDTKANLLAFAQRRGLVSVVDGEIVNATGFDYTLWGGAGRFMTKAGTYNAEGDELTAPTFYPGVVAILRINEKFRYPAVDEDAPLGDTITPDEDDPDREEQHTRSRAAQWVRGGTPGSIGPIQTYTRDDVTFLRYADVVAWCQAKGLPFHQWLEGNAP